MIIESGLEAGEVGPVLTAEIGKGYVDPLSIYTVDNTDLTEIQFDATGFAAPLGTQIISILTPLVDTDIAKPQDYYKISIDEIVHNLNLGTQGSETVVPAYESTTTLFTLYNEFDVTTVTWADLKSWVVDNTMPNNKYHTIDFLNTGTEFIRRFNEIRSLVFDQQGVSNLDKDLNSVGSFAGVTAIGLMHTVTVMDALNSGINITHSTGVRYNLIT